jgi:hypothetical protein
MFDAPTGYHQLAIAVASQEKLTFQGVNAIKWTYTVMLFGPTNGPKTLHLPYQQCLERAQENYPRSG